MDLDSDRISTLSVGLVEGLSHVVLRPFCLQFSFTFFFFVLFSVAFHSCNAAVKLQISRAYRTILDHPDRDEGFTAKTERCVGGVHMSIALALSRMMNHVIRIYFWLERYMMQVSG